MLKSEESSDLFKEIALRLLLCLISITENVNENVIMEHLMASGGLFDALVFVMSERKSRLVHGRNALLILTLLIQYRKYESENVYRAKLSLLDDELALTVSSLQLPFD